MAIQESEVKVGALYYAGNNQLRKVVDLYHDDKMRMRVVYESKSIKIKGRPFGFGHTKSNPPLIPTFCMHCTGILSKSDIEDLKLKKIIIPGECSV